MALGLELIRGVGLGIEFPGDGFHVVITLLILRVFLADEEVLKDE
jgi:hypothetical protein